LTWASVNGDRPAGRGPARRFFLAAFGDPGHAFPVIALGRELVARGHDVTMQTWRRWRDDVESQGMRFEPALEYRVWPRPSDGEGLKPYAAAVGACRETVPLVGELDPDAVVVDILTLAVALAAQAADRPWATVVPHVLPTSEPGFPPFSIGARLPRTRLGRALWRALDPVSRPGIERGRVELNGARARVGLAPLDHPHGGLSRQLALVATFPALEYPRSAWDPAVRIVGPLLYEPPCPDIELPPGDDPLVLVAPSTSQDPDGRLLQAALAGLAGERVRVLAAAPGRRDGSSRLPAGMRVPPNARAARWIPYSRVMPECAAVVCHGGHGTIALALRAGAPVLVSPGGGDMAEMAARLAWAGAGLSLPRRLTSPRAVRLGVRRLIADAAFGERAAELAAWSRANPGPPRAAAELESFVARGGVAEPAPADGLPVG
jgi:UDP:flavonoid glycosyltransferase YjiC (YdhE family)